MQPLSDVQQLPAGPGKYSLVKFILFIQDLAIV